MEVVCDVLRFVSNVQTHTRPRIYAHTTHENTRRKVNLFDVYFSNKFELPGFDLSVGRPSPIAEYGAQQNNERKNGRNKAGTNGAKKERNETFVY